MFTITYFSLIEASNINVFNFNVGTYTVAFHLFTKHHVLCTMMFFRHVLLTRCFTHRHVLCAAMFYFPPCFCYHHVLFTSIFNLSQCFLIAMFVVRSVTAVNSNVVRSVAESVTE